MKRRSSYLTVVENSARRLSRIMGVVGAYSALVMAFIVTYDVLMRYVFSMPTTWAFELSEYILIIVFFCGSSYCLLLDGHVSVDLITSRLPAIARAVLEIISSLIGAVFCFVLTWQSWKFFGAAYAGSWHSDTILSFPLIYPYFFMASGLTVLTIQYFVKVMLLSIDIFKENNISDRGEIDR